MARHMITFIRMHALCIRCVAKTVCEMKLCQRKTHREHFIVTSYSTLCSFVSYYIQELYSHIGEGHRFTFQLSLSQIEWVINGMLEIMVYKVGWSLQCEQRHNNLTRDVLQPENADSECRENTLDNIAVDSLICCVARTKMIESQSTYIADNMFLHDERTKYI